MCQNVTIKLHFKKLPFELINFALLFGTVLSLSLPKYPKGMFFLEGIEVCVVYPRRSRKAQKNIRTFFEFLSAGNAAKHRYFTFT